MLRPPWVVIAIAVVKQIALVILILGREAEGIELGHRTGGAEDFTEGAVFVGGAVGGGAGAADV